jgi:hemoglobin/transferrin/lactoferrin receptor protein
MIDLSAFAKADTLTFRKTGYFTLHKCLEQLFAQSNPIVTLKADQMQAIIISASRFEQNRREVPARTVLIDREEVFVTQPQTSADLLQQSGQVFVQKSQQGGGSPMIRGFSTNRLLLTVDGVRMNTAIFRSGNLQNIINIDPLSIERSEVVLGPGSVIYGSDAIGGVMNFYTLKPRFSQDSLDFTGDLVGRYSTANQENTGHLNFNFGSRKWASRTSISFNRFGNLTMGSHGPNEYLREEYVIRQNDGDFAISNPNDREQVPTGYSQINLLQKLAFKPSEHIQLNAGIIYSSTSDFDRYDALIRRNDQGQFRNAEWYYGPQSWFMGSLQTLIDRQNKWFDQAKITAAYQHFEESRNERQLDSPNLISNLEEVDAFSLNADFRKIFNSEHGLTYGFEGIVNSIESRGFSTDITTGEVIGAPTRYPDDSTWQSWALYLLHKWNPLDNLAIETGLRYNLIDVDANLQNRLAGLDNSMIDLQTDAFTGSLGAVLTPNESWRYTASLGTAFRAPNVDDMGKLFDPDPGTVIVPNPHLRPEYSYTAELGIGKDFKSKVEIGLNTYFTYLENALAPDDFTINGNSVIEFQDDIRRVQAIQNSENAVIYGLEFAGRWSISEHLRLVTHLNKTWGEQEKTDGATVPVRHVAPLFGDATLDYRNNRIRAQLYGQFNGELEFDELSPDLQRRDYLFATDENGNPYSPAWYIITLRMGYDLSESVELDAILENLTDQRYRTYSSGIAAAGRNLVVALRYTF